MFPFNNNTKNTEKPDNLSNDTLSELDDQFVDGLVEEIEKIVENDNNTAPKRCIPKLQFTRIVKQILVPYEKRISSKALHILHEKVEEHMESFFKKTSILLDHSNRKTLSNAQIKYFDTNTFN